MLDTPAAADRRAHVNTPRNPNKARLAYQRLRELFGEGDLLGDEEPLTESRLMKLVGMNRGPIRDSLLRLEGEGKIRFRGKRRGRVIEFLENQNKDELLQRYKLREFIAAGAARSAAMNMTGHHLEALKHLAQQTEDAELGSPTRQHAAGAFWNYLFANCGNTLFEEVWNRFRLRPPAPRAIALEIQIMKNISEKDRRLGALTHVAEAIASHDVDHAEQIIRRAVRIITRSAEKTDWGADTA